MSNQAGKGSELRKGANLEAYWSNYDLAFRKRKTIPEWATHFGDRIKSYDGFREYKGDHLLTEEEYKRGLPRCTMYIDKTVLDGFGSEWSKCSNPECGLSVVRPGKVQCWCDGPLDNSEFIIDDGSVGKFDQLVTENNLPNWKHS